MVKVYFISGCKFCRYMWWQSVLRNQIIPWLLLARVATSAPCILKIVGERICTILRPMMYVGQVLCMHDAGYLLGVYIPGEDRA